MTTTSLAQIARAQIARLPEVTAMVVAERSGALIEATGDIDGESAGAVYAVVVQALDRVGEILGLGPLARTAVTGPRTACLVAGREDGVVGVHLDPRKPLGPIERKLEGTLRP